MAIYQRMCSQIGTLYQELRFILKKGVQEATGT